MPLDALHLHAISLELDRLLSDGRIDRVTMPTADDILLAVHTRQNGNVRLLLSANPARPRVWLTPLDYVNPLVAPSFCMHLRKYLTSARIRSVSSSPYERVVSIVVESRSELGDMRTMTLVVEIMGRYSNLLLTDDRGVITDCIKHTPLERDTVRIVLPGVVYKPVGREDGKHDASDRDALFALLDAYPGGDLCAHLMTGLCGLATQTLRLCLGDLAVSVPPTAEQKHAIADRLESLYRSVGDGDYTARLLANDFTVVPCDGKAYPTLLEAETAFYARLDAETQRKNAAAGARSALTTALKKLKKRSATLEAKLKECAEADKFRLWGELLTANLYRLAPRADRAELENYYTGETVTIPLDPLRTPVQNANACYKKYAKLKRAQTVTEELLAKTRDETDYYESVLASLDTCETAEDFALVTEELVRAGLVRSQRRRGDRPVRSTPAVLRYRGFRIAAGKNNLQNDALTFKTADADDLWLHVKASHGSHVIVFCEGRAVPDDVLAFAAGIAAWYSSCRNATKVSVDCTRKKYVLRNPSKGPGNVTYTHYETFVVDPIPPEQAERSDGKEHL